MTDSVAVAVSAPTLAVITWLPVDMLGIVMVAVKLPVEVVVMLVGLVAILLLSRLMVTDVFGAKLLPVIVTAVPTGPLSGDGTIEGAFIILNTAVPIFPVSSVTVTV